jgi:DNA-entry nuclease
MMNKHKFTRILTAVLASASMFAFGANAKPTQSIVQAVSAKRCDE